MYAIEKGTQKINGELIPTFQREIISGDTDLIVTAGTNGYKGSCARKAGGRSFLSILSLEGDFHFGPIMDDEGSMTGVEIACCGDGGLNALLKALDFSRQVLNEQKCGFND